MSTNIILAQRTCEEQSEHIKKLTRQNKELKNQIDELKNQIDVLKNKLYDAEAIIVCNRLVYPEGVKNELTQAKKETTKCLKTFFVPAKSKR